MANNANKLLILLDTDPLNSIQDLKSELNLPF